MKLIGKSLAILLTLAILICSLGVTAAGQEEDSSVTFSLRVEGISETLYYNPAITLNYEGENLTLSAALAMVGEMEDAPSFTLEEGEYGTYLSAVNDEAEASFGGYDGWLYRVDGVSPDEGIGSCVLSDGLEVLLYYSDEFGVGMQFPAADVSLLISDGIVSFTSLDTVYDDDYNPAAVINPVAGASVTWDGADYITDEDGKILVAAETRTIGSHSVGIERCEESGLPTVLRYAPGTAVSFAFDDVSESDWYYSYVCYVVNNALYKGTSPTGFDPAAPMTRAMLVTVLWRLDGEPDADGEAAFEDVGSGRWYSGAIAWASSEGVAGGYGSGLFGPNDTVSREQMAAIICNYAKYAGLYAENEGSIDGFEDADSVSAWAADALCWAVGEGIIEGSEGRLNPGGDTQRCQVAKVLALLGELEA